MHQKKLNFQGRFFLSYNVGHANCVSGHHVVSLVSTIPKFIYTSLPDDYHRPNHTIKKEISIHKYTMSIKPYLLYTV